MYKLLLVCHDSRPVSGWSNWGDSETELGRGRACCKYVWETRVGVKYVLLYLSTIQVLFDVISTVFFTFVENRLILSLSTNTFLCT